MPAPSAPTPTTSNHMPTRRGPAPDRVEASRAAPSTAAPSPARVKPIATSASRRYSRRRMSAKKSLMVAAALTGYQGFDGVGDAARLQVLYLAGVNKRAEKASIHQDATAAR